MATTRFRDQDPNVDQLYSDLADDDLQPLWVQHGLLSAAPNRLAPHLWRGKSLRDLAQRSGDLIGVSRGGDRRVLALAHPALGGLPFATHTLWGAVQFLGPGEYAPAHRHSPAALRFVLEGSGAWTIVNGDPVSMAPGDLVLTPAYTWHEHHNAGAEPVIWFDGLDLPFVHGLDAVFFEPGPAELRDYPQVLCSESENQFGTAGIVPVGADSMTSEDPATGRFSRQLAYRWSAVDQALSRLLKVNGAPEAVIRYTDPLTGGDVMPTLRAELHRISAGQRTETVRTVGSGLWVVHRGSGATVIDGHRYRWAAGDMFVIPSWAAVDHEAEHDADLFVLSDQPVIEAAALVRTERLPRQDVRSEDAS